VRRRPTRRLLQQSRVPLQEVDLEEEIEGEGTEVEERRQEAPILEMNQTRPVSKQMYQIYLFGTLYALFFCFCFCTNPRSGSPLVCAMRNGLGKKGMGRGA